MNSKLKLLLEELGLENPSAANRLEWKNMAPQKDDGIREEEAREQAIEQLYSSNNRSGWIAGVVVAALVLASAVFLASGRNHNSHTTTTDGRSVESPVTANSGSAR